MMTNPRMPPLVRGFVLGGLTLASHGLLRGPSGDDEERLGGVEQQQELWMPSVAVPSVGSRYTGGRSRP